MPQRARPASALHLRFCAGSALLLLLAGGNLRLSAQDDEWKVISAVGWESACIFRGVERAGSSARGSVEAGREGFRLGAAVNAPFRRSDPDETDLTAAYRFKVDDAFALEAGATQFILGRTAPGVTRQSAELEARGIWTIPGGATVAVEYDRDFRLRADTWQAALGYDLALKKLGAYLKLEASVGETRGTDLRPDSPRPCVADSYQYFEVGARLPYRIGAHTTLVADMQVFDAFGQDSRWSPIDAAGRFRVRGGIAVSFDF